MHNHLLKGKKVAIIGGGPVGLAMARLLQQTGVEVSVYERDRDPHTRVWGGTLDLHEGSGQEALKRAGLLEGYFALARPMGRTMTDEKGQVLQTVPAATDRPEINRNNLRTLLLDSLTPGTVIWDRKFTGLDAHENGWTLHFDHAPDATADFVIGANGGLSLARQYVSDAAVEDTGTLIVQGEVANPERACPAFFRLCDDRILMAAHKGILLVANPDNNGRLTYNVMYKQPMDSAEAGRLSAEGKPCIATHLQEKLSDWDVCFRQLVQSTTSFVVLPTRKLPLISWHHQRRWPITLIGDAAHIMPPFAGEGLNIGLKDTFTLLDHLTGGNHKSIAAVIEGYEQEMFLYARQAQAQTALNEARMMQPDFSFQQMFR